MTDEEFRKILIGDDKKYSKEEVDKAAQRALKDVLNDLVEKGDGKNG